MNSLMELSQKEICEALLLAEVAAWLHDDFKHTDQHISKYVLKGAPKLYGRQDAEDLIPLRRVTLLGQTLPFSDVRKWRKKVDFVKGYLKRCHYTAHIEKRDGDAPQSYPVFLSTPFGFEWSASKIPPDLTRGLRSNIKWSILGSFPITYIDRNNLCKQISELFSKVGGDTRRPANEITLWDWGHTVGAFYKAALAGALLGFQPQADDLRWRLLSIRLDGFSFFVKSAQLPDLLARKHILVDSLDEIRKLLEITYPLGTEVYRDENGSVFVVPGCEKENCSLDLLAMKNGGKTLCQNILEKVWEKIEGELVPAIRLDPEPWWGQDPKRLNRDEPPPIPDHLKSTESSPDSRWAVQQWNVKGMQICTVCGLRPQGPSQKAEVRQVCDVCEKRRADRSSDWAAKKLDTTIWIDEVADLNGRLALIGGKFDLTHWLSGNMVRTLAAQNPEGAANKTANEVAKNPSFARIRSIWKTTSRFWQEVCSADEGTDLTRSLVGKQELVGQKGLRLEIKPNDAEKLDLAFYHAYDLVLERGIKMSVVWDSSNKRFISCDNLDYLATKGQLDQPIMNVLHRGSILAVEEPVGYGAKNKVWGEVEIAEVAVLDNTYVPAIAILSEPRTFMMLVPADKALDVVHEIKAKYEREMGKVRNRLPLHLGVVYAGRRTPLRAILDAGRRMLNQSAQSEGWNVVHAALKAIDRGDQLPKRFEDDNGGQFHQWFEILLENDERRLRWYIPAVMGDGTTKDSWYPYVFLNTTNEPIDRNRYFQAHDPWNASGWLMHVADLKTNDVIHFNPSTLDFQWLDSAGRRFEIAYDKQGQRCGLSRRPYLLDELETLNKIWETLRNHLTKNQIYILRDLIEAKRTEWQITEQRPDENCVFWKFCHDALANAYWENSKENSPLGKLPWVAEGQDRETWLAQWANYAARGWLADVVELHLQIMKEEVKVNDEF